MKIKANLFKELSNKNTPIEIEAGQEVGRAFGEIDTENAVFLVNGQEVDPAYILQPADVVTVRVLPSAATTAVIGAVAVVAVGAAVVGGVALYKVKKAKDQAKEEMEKMKKLSNSPTVDNRPFLRGATNSIALGNSQAYAMGRNFFTPYLHCTPFYRLAGTDGETQFIYHSVECGFNSQVFSKIGIDDIVIKSFSDTTPQQGGFTLDGGQVFADGVGEISQNGEELKTIPELNYKVVSLPQNEEIKRDAAVAAGRGEYFTATLPPNAVTVDVAITFPAGLWAYNDNNDKVTTSCTVTPQFSLDGGQSWQGFTFNNNGTMTNTFTRNEPTKELRYNAHYDFTENDYAELKAAGQGVIIVRVRSNGVEDSKVKNDVYVLFIQSVIFDPNKSSKPAGVLDDGGFAGLVPCKVVEDRERKYCTILGLKIKATRNNEDKLKRINIISTSTARVWDGAKWSTDKRPTRNLAALLLEVLTSHTHPTSRIDDAELDLESFGEAYEWCENNGYMYDAVITSGIKKRDIIAQMLAACGGVLYRDLLGRYAVAMDRPQENALAVFNAQNIVTITNKKGFQRRTDGLRLHYINSQNDLYKEDTYLLMREVNGRPLPITPDSIIKDVNLQGVTTFNHVVKYARRLMAIEALRPKVTTIEIGNEGIFYTPLSKVLIQDDSLKGGLSNGVIKSAVYIGDNLSRLIIDGFVNIENGKRYGVIINGYDESAGIIQKIEVRGTGRTNELEVVTPAPVVVEAGCTFSFGELEIDGSFGKVATPYVIQSIARRGSRFILDLVNYNEAIFDVGTIPDYVSNITEKPTPAPALPIFAKDGADGKNGKDGKNGAAGMTPFIEKSAVVYNANAAGVVVESVIRDKIRLEQEGVAIPFTIGRIDSPAGFEITSEGDTVIIKALAGADMALNGVIKIPINYSAVEIIRYKDESKNIYIDGYGDAYADIKILDENLYFDFYVSYAKSPKGDQGEQGLQGEKGEQGLQGEKGEQGPQGEKGADGKNGKDGKDGKDGTNGKDGARAPKYWGKRTSAPTQDGVVIGDYYLDIDTVRLYRCYGISAENVASWESLTPDEAPDLYFLQINEVMSLISKLPADDPVKLFVNNYVQLLLVDTEFVNYLGAKKIRILENGVIIGGDRYNDDGTIKDFTKNGFYQSANGIAKMRLVGDEQHNLLLGTRAGQNLVKSSNEKIASCNNCIGVNAGSSITEGCYNNIIGCYTGEKLTTGWHNVLIGQWVARELTSGSNNICLGHQSGYRLTTGSNNILLGQSSGNNLSTGEHNQCIGFYSGWRLTEGKENSLFGNQSGEKITTGTRNACIGYCSGAAITTGSNNICIGEAGGPTTGSENVCIGIASGNNISGGTHNICAGHFSGASIDGGNNNLCLGNLAGRFINGGNDNICLGNSAGHGLLLGTTSDGIFIGRDAGANASGNNCICIGANADVKTYKQDGQINIGNVFKYDGRTATVENLRGLPDVGDIKSNASAITPTGWLRCNGSAISRATYSRLFQAIGTKYGSGDGSTTFNVPDLTDKFVMGAGNKAWGSSVAAGLPNIEGQLTAGSGGWESFAPQSGLFRTYGGVFNGTATGVPGYTNYKAVYFDAKKINSIYGNSTTVQPPAIAMYYYIKY